VVLDLGRGQRRRGISAITNGASHQVVGTYANGVKHQQRLDDRS